jgi:hypothetical protein
MFHRRSHHRRNKLWKRSLWHKLNWTDKQIKISSTGIIAADPEDQRVAQFIEGVPGSGSEAHSVRQFKKNTTAPVCVNPFIQRFETPVESDRLTSLFF